MSNVTEPTQLELTRGALKLCGVPFSEELQPNGQVSIHVDNTPRKNPDHNIRCLFVGHAHFNAQGVLVSVVAPSPAVPIDPEFRKECVKRGLGRFLPPEPMLDYYFGQGALETRM